LRRCLRSLSPFPPLSPPPPAPTMCIKEEGSSVSCELARSQHLESTERTALSVVESSAIKRGSERPQSEFPSASMQKTEDEKRLRIVRGLCAFSAIPIGFSRRAISPTMSVATEKSGHDRPQILSLSLSLSCPLVSPCGAILRHGGGRGRAFTGTSILLCGDAPSLTECSRHSCGVRCGAGEGGVGYKNVIVRRTHAVRFTSKRRALAHVHREDRNLARSDASRLP